jgi:quercetin dioxygenase-like cupin family protein
MRSVILLALTLSASAAAQVAPAGKSTHVILTSAEEIVWGPAPAVLPPGAKAAVIEGNPAEKGEFTLRLLMPDGYKIAPHYHPSIEHVTVVKGTFKVGMGDSFDSSTMRTLRAGAFAAIQPGTRHFAEAEGETILQLHGVGPWGLIYVNPADDPQKRTP